MSLSSQVFLGALRLQAQQRSSTENNPAISIPEWNQYLSQSYKELYDILVSAYGEDYEFAVPFQFTTSQNQFYPFPDGSQNFLGTDGNPAGAFYKLIGVDLQYSASPTGWVTLPRYNFIDRNKFGNQNTTVQINAYTNLKYRPLGNQISLVPIPSSGQVIQLWYAPKPTALSFFPLCSTTISSLTVGVSDTIDLSVGMNAYGPGVNPGTVLTNVNAGLSQVTLSQVATATQGAICLQFWTDAATFDGISGWEEYIIIDAAIKAGLKLENDVEGLTLQKAEMKTRIETMARGRDIGQAEHTTDAMAIQDCRDGFGGYGNGGGY